MINRDFNHIIISPYLKFFGEQMKDRWGLIEITEKNIHKYKDVPAVVLGYHLNKVPSYKNLIDKHVGPQIICWGGGGDLLDPNLYYAKNRKISNSNLNYVKNRKSLTYSIGKSNDVKNILTKYNIPFLERYVPYKDYSLYKPTPLGTGIYCHVGWFDHPQARKRLCWETLVKPLIKKYGNDVKYVPFVNGRRFNTNEMINLYDKCCVYMKPKPLGGSTTMWDMAYMGRKTICHNMSDMYHIIDGPPNICGGKNLNKLFDLIDIERSKFGTIAHDVAESAFKEHIQTDEWLTLEFWENI